MNSISLLQMVSEPVQSQGITMENQNSENYFEKIRESMKEIIRESMKDLQSSMSSMEDNFKQVMETIDDLRASSGKIIEMISEMKTLSSDSEELKVAEYENQGNSVVHKVFDKMHVTDIDKDASRFGENDYSDVHPLQMLANVESFKQISSSSINRHVGIEGFYVKNKLIDKCAKVDGYIAELNPEPPDDYRQLIQCGTMELKLDPMNVMTITRNYEEGGIQQFTNNKYYQRQLDGTLEAIEDVPQQDDDPIVFKVGDNEGFQTEVPSPLIHRLPDQLIRVIVVSGIALPSGSNKLYTWSKDVTVRVRDCQSDQGAGVINLIGEVSCMFNEGPWVFVGLPNVVKAWNAQTATALSLSRLVGQVYALVVGNNLLFAGTPVDTILSWKFNVVSNSFELAALLKGHIIAFVALFPFFKNKCGEVVDGCEKRATNNCRKQEFIFYPGGVTKICFSLGYVVNSSYSNLTIDQDLHIQRSLACMLAERCLTSSYSLVFILVGLSLTGCPRQNFIEMIGAKLFFAFFVQKLFMPQWNQHQCGHFNSSVTDQEAILETVAKITHEKMKKNETQEANVLDSEGSEVITTLIVKRNNIITLYGPVTIETLILQDGAVGLLFALLLILGGSSGVLQGMMSMAKPLVILSTFLAILSILCHTFTPWFLKLMISISSQTNELYQLAVVTLCLIVVWCSDKLGQHLELGSFAVRMMISTTDLAQHTLEQVEPICNFFAALIQFFANIGMFIHVHFLWSYIGMLLADVILVILIKTAVVAIIAKETNNAMHDFHDVLNWFFDFYNGVVGAQHFMGDGGTTKDWEGINRIASPPHSDCTYSVEASILAGIDMVMVLLNYTEFIDNLTYLIKNNFIPMDHLDNVVGRILLVKFIFGLFENPLAELSLVDQVGNQLAREAVRKSFVLLKNGEHSNNLGYQCYKWTFNWQGFSGKTQVTAEYQNDSGVVVPNSVLEDKDF